MNDSLSDGNGNIIDIFVLSTDATDSPVEAGYLKDRGYRVTFFADAEQLSEALRAGKPNILVCDAVTFQEEAYDICHRIKDDFDLWVIPVLIVTGASNLSDLLHVLDCNADNFISQPYDPAYLTSLIEGMLATPVERPTSEQIKTQFKIQHDDRMFVVTADRRRLLEFLLSSFEIGVNRSITISRIMAENETFSASLRQAEGQVRDQAQSLESLSGTLQERDETISTLTAECAEKDRQIQKNAAEIRQLDEDLVSLKDQSAADREEIQRLTRAAEEAADRSAKESGGLSQQVSCLSERLAAANAELKETEASLARETGQRTEAESRIVEITSLKEQVEKTVKALTLETEQMRAALATEKNHARSVEYDLNALVQAKNESEQNLTRLIDELKETARQQGAELANRTDELDTGKTRIERLENQILDLTADKERAETELDTRTAVHATEIQDLRALLDETRAMLAERERETVSLKTAVKEIEEIRDKAGQDNKALSDELSATRATLNEDRERFRAAEERMAGEIRERDNALQELHGEHQSAQSDLDEHRSTLSRVRSDLESALSTRSDIESSLDAATARIRDLESELETSRSLSRNTEETLASERQAREQASRDLESAIAERAGLESSLEVAKAKIQELESGLVTATSASANTGKQVHALASELEQVKAELENSRRQRHEAGESLASLNQERERLASEIQTMSQDHAALSASLEEEKRSRSAAEAERDRLQKLLAAAESGGKLQESYQITAIQKLSAELEASHSVQRDLEERAAVLLREKQVAEETAASLAAEIDQARSALADEWEDHMEAREQLDTAVQQKQQVEGTAESLAEEIGQARTALADEWGDHMEARERLDAAIRQKQLLEASIHPPGELESEKAKKRSLIIKGPDLPMNAGIRPRPFSAVPPAGAVIPVMPVPRITNIDDLFEDDEPEEEHEEIPSVSIIHESVSDDTPEDTIAADNLTENVSGIPFESGVTDPVDGDGEPEEEGEEPSIDMPVENEEEDVFEDDPAPAPEGSSRVDSWGVSLNRAQWYDLLKWAHHSGTLTQDQRMQIVRMGRLMQRGRKLTPKQEEQVRDLLSLAQAQGYRFSG
ncbi:MAG: response regulator [Methanoregula sp.]